jgi:hypothetical protein
METYEVYFTGEGGCDSEWDYLGRIEVESQVKAQEQSRKRWKDYSPEYLVVCPCSVKSDCIPVLAGKNAA